MNTLLRSAIVVLILSVVAFVWGYSYTQQNKSKAWGAMFGHRDPTYEAAGYATIAGVAGFLIGIGLLIGGLVKQKETSSRQRTPSHRPSVQNTSQQYCKNCGTLLADQAEYCGNCGAGAT